MWRTTDPSAMANRSPQVQALLRNYNSDAPRINIPGYGDRIGVADRNTSQRLALFAHAEPDSESLAALAGTATLELERSLLALKAPANSLALHIIAGRSEFGPLREYISRKVAPDSPALVELLRTARNPAEVENLLGLAQADTPLLQYFAQSVQSAYYKLRVIERAGTDSQILAQCAREAADPQVREKIFEQADPDSQALVELFRSSRDFPERTSILKKLTLSAVRRNGFSAVLRDPDERQVFREKLSQELSTLSDAAEKASTRDEFLTIVANCPIKDSDICQTNGLARRVDTIYKTLAKRSQDADVHRAIMHKLLPNRTSYEDVLCALAHEITNPADRLTFALRAHTSDRIATALAQTAQNAEERRCLRLSVAPDSTAMHYLAVSARDANERMDIARSVAPDSTAFAHLAETVNNVQEREILLARGIPTSSVYRKMVAAAPDAKSLRLELKAAETLLALRRPQHDPS